MALISFHKAGIMLSDFTDSAMSQLNLFSEHKPFKASDELMKTIDLLNNSGVGKVWFAGKGIDKGWRMKRDMLSSAYTTKITDFPVVKIY